MPLPATALVQQPFTALAGQQPEMDHADLVTLLEQWSGTQVQEQPAGG